MINPVRTWQQDVARWGVILVALSIVIGVALYALRAESPTKLSLEDVAYKRVNVGEKEKMDISKESYLLQVGSFTNLDDANKLKVKLATLGFEANIRTTTIPDKGVWHRLNLGPYKSDDEMVKTRGRLKQHGIDSTPMRVPQ